jgi:hypothetical protein
MSGCFGRRASIKAAQRRPAPEALTWYEIPKGSKMTTEMPDKLAVQNKVNCT